MLGLERWNVYNWRQDKIIFIFKHAIFKFIFFLMQKVFLYTLEMTMREWKRTGQFEMPIIWIIVGFNPQDMGQTCRHKFPPDAFIFEKTNDAEFFCSTHVLLPIGTNKGDQVLFRIIHFHNSKKLVIVIFRQSTKPESILNTKHRNRGVDMLVSKYFPTIVCNWSKPWILWDVFIQIRIANLRLYRVHH